ncbi:hypothetical protein D3C87_1630530 [compost metagenome]
MDIFCGFFLNGCRHVIERHDTFHDALVVDHGHGHQILLREQVTDLLLVHFNGNFDHVCVHDLGDFFTWSCREQFSERNHSQKFLVLV